MASKIKQKILLYRLQSKPDPEAYAKLYDIYVKQIYRFVYFKVSSHEEAEDITSEVFLKAWHYINDKSKKKVNSFSGLLYRLARNTIIDLYRKKAKRTEIKLVDENSENRIEYKTEKNVEEIGDKGKWQKDIETKIEVENLLEILQNLKYEYKEIITLRYVDGLEINEIAEITGKRKVAVRVMLHRAVKKLKILRQQ
jgi:RNA polymerase sigma-70 factor (ECF subfamily)